jgi:dihydrofolate reductase
MSNLVVFESVTLDGVMQAPGRADEDPRGGFEHGGWATAYNDPVMGQVVGEGMATAGPLLFGRRTYEDFFKVWPGRSDNPFTEVLDRTQKYVASKTLRAPLPWINSTLLDGDVPAAVTRLKDTTEKDIVVLGSGELVRSLMLHRLIDVYILLIHPLVLGTGRRLFPDNGTLGALRLVNATPTTTGVVIAAYRLV